MGESKSSGSGRTRNYATVVYPESAPSNWLELLSNEVVPCFVSPLHDSDLNPTGESKKAHYHVLFCFEGVKTKEQVNQIVTKIGGVGLEVVNSLRGYARYLCHLDNPDKAQYKTENVKQFGGADYSSTINLPTDKYKCIKEMMDYCKENNVVSYSDLLEYAAVYHFEWFRVLCDNGTVVIKEYLKSRSWTVSNATNRPLTAGPDTNELKEHKTNESTC